MCLIALALDAHPRWSLVIAANRDEFFARPTHALSWWQASPEAPPLLSGRDLAAGGTWLGLSRSGRVGMLTNVRDPARVRDHAPSRGLLVTDWLSHDLEPETAWSRMAHRGCNPFNFVGGDLRRHEWWWADDRSSAPTRLGTGVHGVSNAALNTPWPKVQRVTRAVGDVLSLCHDAVTLTTTLFDVLRDPQGAADHLLPDTGVGLSQERWLAAPFVRSPNGQYGTRGSTVVLGERQAGAWSLYVTERVFNAQGVAVSQRHMQWRWPAVPHEMPHTG